MKKIGVVVVILVALAVWKIAGGKQDTFTPQEEGESPTPITMTEQMGHPLSIQGLKNRNYDGGKIQTVRTVRQTDAFISTVISYSSDGLKQYALMNTPKGNIPDGGWPIVIVNHGHIAPAAYSTENSYINTSAYFANAGFVVLKPDYRGHDNSEGSADGLINRIEYAVDVLNLMASIKTLPDVNTDKLFMYGHSMGGDVSLRILEVNNQVKAATLWAPAVTTFPESVYYFRRRNTAGEPRLPQAQKEFNALTRDNSADDFSPMAHIDLVQVPVLIHHSTTDESVPYRWGVDLDAALKKAGKTVTFYTYPNDNHDISRNWGTALGRDVAFFKQY